MGVSVPASRLGMNYMNLKGSKACEPYLFYQVINLFIIRFLISDLSLEKLITTKAYINGLRTIPFECVRQSS